MTARATTPVSWVVVRDSSPLVESAASELEVLPHCGVTPRELVPFCPLVPVPVPALALVPVPALVMVLVVLMPMPPYLPSPLTSLWWQGRLRWLATVAGSLLVCRQWCPRWLVRNQRPGP